MRSPMVRTVQSAGVAVGLLAASNGFAAARLEYRGSVLTNSQAQSLVAPWLR